MRNRKKIFYRRPHKVNHAHEEHLDRVFAYMSLVLTSPYGKLMLWLYRQLSYSNMYMYMSRLSSANFVGVYFLSRM